MAWRKWFVRLLVFTIVGSGAGAVLVYQRFTNPAAVREQVMAKLTSHFAGAVVTVDSARLRILGGIIVNELRLARKNDPDKSEILHVPTALLYHDKEKILGGELVLRKVELDRPHLRVQRNKDGSWNLEGIGGKLQPNLPLPIVAIHQGTLEFEDRSPSGIGKVVELTDVDLRLVNDPLDLVTIVGSAHSEMAGKLHISGQWQRHSNEISLTLKAEQISLAGIVVERLEKLCPAGTLEGLKLEGTADLKAELAYRPGSSQPLSYDVWLNVTKATVRHPKLPLPFDELSASLRCSNGDLRLEKLTAKSGQTEIEAHAAVVLPFIDQTFEAHLEARHLEIHERLLAVLPEKVAKLYHLFLPTGLATFRADVARRAGLWTTLASGEPATLQLAPEAMGMTFAKFRYPLDNLTGSVDVNLLTPLVEVAVTGYTGPRPIVIKGTWQGEGLDADGTFDIYGTDLPLDEKIVTAFVQPNMHKLAKSFNATGKGDLKAFIRHEPGSKDFHNEYHVRFHDAAIRWEPFSYAVEKITGFLDIYPKTWEFRDGRGVHAGGEVFVEASSLTPATVSDKTSESPVGPANVGVYLDIVGRHIAVDEDLHQALEPIKQLGHTWTTFRPGGQLNFRAKIEHRTKSADDPGDADIQLEVQGGTIEPIFFRYALDDITGKFHFHKNKLEVRDASARHKGTTLTLDQGLIDLHPGGGHYTDLTGLKAQGLVMDEDFLQALPKHLRDGAAAIKLKDPLNFETRLVVAQAAEPGSPPVVWWDGQCWLKNAKFVTGLEWSKVTGTVGALGSCNGSKLIALNGNILLDEATLVGQPFRKMHAKFQIQETAPDKLLLGLKAPIFGGDISGEARIDFNSTLGYEINLTGSQIDLAEFGRHNLGARSKLQGVAMARLHLTGHGTSSDNLDGNGSIDIPNGRLYNLPLLLDILKFLGWRWPDSTAFEELHALFGIHGKRVSVRKLEILGNAISLTGQGEFNLDGTDVALDFYPGWARLNQLLPPAVRPLPPAVNKNLLTIEMRGKVTANEKDRKFTMKPIPGIVDPLLHIRNRLMGMPNGDARDEPHMLPSLGGQ